MNGTASRGRGFGLRLLLAGLVVVCLQVVVFLLILDDTVGGVSLRSRTRPRDASMTREMRAVVLRSGSSAALWGASERYDQRVRAWLEALAAAGVTHQVVDGPQLGRALASATVLVLPGTACLDEPARLAVRRFLDSGGGVVASGAVGTRDGSCAWRGWDFLSQLPQAGDFETLPREGSFATFRGGQFYDGALPAGYRLELPFQELVVVPAADPDAYLSDWRLRPARGFRVGASTLALHRTLGAGRVVWFGFDESAFGRRPEPQQVLEGYLARAASWAGRDVIGTVPTWPAAQDAAAIVAVVVGEDGGPVRALAGELERAGIPGTYVVEGERAANLSSVNAAEVAIGVPSGSALTIAGAAGRAARARLERTTGRTVQGVLVPGGTRDPGLRRALAEAGFSYSLDEIMDLRGSPDVSATTPSLLSIRPPPELLRVFRTAAGHEEVLANYQGLEENGTGFLWDFERLLYLRGVYPLVLRSDLFGDAQRAALRELFARIKSSSVWATTGRGLADWWSARRHLDVRVRRLSPYRLQLDVSNHGHRDLSDLPVFVQLGYRPQRVALRSPVFRLTLPSWSLAVGLPLLRLDFPEVRAQTNYTFVIALDE